MLELAQEKMSKSLGNIVSLRDSLDEWGSEPLLLLFLGAHYRSPVEYSDESMEAARTQASDFRTAFRVVERSDGAPSWDDFAAALDDDFNTPLALSILHAWRSAGERELLERGLAIFGLGVEEAGAAPAEVIRLAEARQEARAAGDYDRADELRAEIDALGWEVQDVPEGFRLDPQGVTPDLVYGRRPVRELHRAGKRQILELLVTERALSAEPWLREVPGLRLQVVPERRLSDAANTRDHQGVVAFCEPYRYADAHSLVEGERPLVVCLDQVTDPHNLGAVVRSAEGAGANGVVITERNAARVTAAVAKASAGAVEHVPVAVVVNLGRYLEEIKGPALWTWAATSDAQTPVWSADLTTGAALVFGAEGRGLRPGVRRSCDDAFTIPLAGSVESLNVSVAAGVALFEAARQRRAA